MHKYCMLLIALFISVTIQDALASGQSGATGPDSQGQRRRNSNNIILKKIIEIRAGTAAGRREVLENNRESGLGGKRAQEVRNMNQAEYAGAPERRATCKDAAKGVAVEIATLSAAMKPAGFINPDDQQNAYADLLAPQALQQLQEWQTALKPHAATPKVAAILRVIGLAIPKCK
jgi:hypothetical protein